MNFLCIFDRENALTCIRLDRVTTLEHGDTELRWFDMDDEDPKSLDGNFCPHELVEAMRLAVKHRVSVICHKSNRKDSPNELR